MGNQDGWAARWNGESFYGIAAGRRVLKEDWDLRTYSGRIFLNFLPFCIQSFGPLDSLSCSSFPASL